MKIVKLKYLIVKHLQLYLKWDKTDKYFHEKAILNILIAW